ncbi:MAG TPA: hypothetical protein QF630_07395 [Alphaproteobacteria bacterium]|nr:hypothetical protein [Alphaproteobacteria bacterium]
MPSAGTISRTRFGGELPLGCDAALASAAALPEDCLAFSNGRAALAWFVERRGPFESVALSAYTCPSVPAAFDGLGLTIGLFDHGAETVTDVVAGLPGHSLVLLPATFGMAPWIDSAALGSAATVIIDAAQTAFGHLVFEAPPGGAVLSCPRKTLALGDGAILRLASFRDDDRAAVSALPDIADISAQKQAGRALFAHAHEADEAEALRLVRTAEAAYPTTPHRMSDSALVAFCRVDAREHARRRKGNLAILRAQLPAPVLGNEGTPFCYPLLLADRDDVMARLHERRIFATPLWPDSRHDPARHAQAARLARELLCLPLDQRYDGDDMALLATQVRACL